MDRRGIAPRPSRTLSPALALLECPAPIYYLGLGLGILCAALLLIAVGVRG